MLGCTCKYFVTLLQMVGNSDFIQATLDTLKKECITTASRDSSFSNSTTDGGGSILDLLRSLVCPNNCSGQGVCVNGNCHFVMFYACHINDQSCTIIIPVIRRYHVWRTLIGTLEYTYLNSVKGSLQGHMDYFKVTEVQCNERTVIVTLRAYVCRFENIPFSCNAQFGNWSMFRNFRCTNICYIV